MSFFDPFDHAVLNWIQQYLTCNFMDSVMLFFTRLGDAGLIWILIGVGLICTKKYRSYGVMVLLALAVAFLLGDQLIKPIVERVRPCNVTEGMEILIKKPRGFSFPSGHTGSSFAAAVVIWGADKRFGIGALILAGLIAFSRLYLYVHYPTDVVAGLILGLTVGGLILVFYRKLQQKRKQAE